MFRFLCKYTPFLKRGFICVLTLLLLVSCFVKPVSVKAAVFSDPISYAIISALFGSGFVSDSVEALASLLADFTSVLGKGIAGVLSTDEGQLLSDFLSISGTKTSYSFDPENRERFARVLLNIILNNPVIRAQLKHNSVDLSKENLTVEDLPLVQSGVQMYVPNQTAMDNVLLISQMQILSEGFETGLAGLSADLRFHLNVLNNNMNQRLQILREYINDMNDYLGWKLESLAQVMVNTRQELSTGLTDLREGFISRLNFQTEVIKNRFIEVNDNFIVIKNTLNNRFAELKTSVEALPRQIGNVISDQFDSLQLSIEHLTETFPALQQRLDQILEKIPVYEEELVTKPQIQVQTPTQTILVSDYASMGQAFSAKMGWIPDIFNFLRDLFQRIVNPSEPPKIPLRLSLAEGSIDWGEDTYFIDMSWYARYKPFVDTIISGILWLVFGWNVYKKVPDILAGVGLSQEPVSSTPLPLTPSSSDQKLLTSRKLLKGGNRYD